MVITLVEIYLSRHASKTRATALNIGLNILLVNTFDLDRTDHFSILIGMLVLWIVGQGVVFGPAKEAINIPLALASRTVYVLQKETID